MLTARTSKEWEDKRVRPCNLPKGLKPFWNSFEVPRNLTHLKAEGKFWEFLVGSEHRQVVGQSLCLIGGQSNAWVG